MKAKKLAALIVTTYISFISTAHASAPQPVFSPEQEARIGEIAADYLVSHPEILVTVSNKLQEQQETRKQKMFALNVMENQANLLHDPDTPACHCGDASCSGRAVADAMQFKYLTA